MITDKDKDLEKKDQQPSEEDKKTTDPQESMEGPVSSILQRAKETIDEEGGKTGGDDEPKPAEDEQKDEEK